MRHILTTFMPVFGLLLFAVCSNPADTDEGNIRIVNESDYNVECSLVGMDIGSITFSLASGASKDVDIGNSSATLGVTFPNGTRISKLLTIPGKYSITNSGIN